MSRVSVPRMSLDEDLARAALAVRASNPDLNPECIAAAADGIAGVEQLDVPLEVAIERVARMLGRRHGCPDVVTRRGPRAA